MSEPKVQQSPSPGQSDPGPSIRVEVRPAADNSALSAFVHVILELSTSQIRLNGFRIFSDSDRVLPPARKGRYAGTHRFIIRPVHELCAYELRGRGGRLCRRATYQAIPEGGGSKRQPKGGKDGNLPPFLPQSARAIPRDRSEALGMPVENDSIRSASSRVQAQSSNPFS
jgi:hypothetical protein